jgi:hypothetical protein
MSPPDTTASPTPAANSKSPLLTARSLKLTLVLNPAELLEVLVVDGVARTTLRIAVGGRVLTADLAMKSVRRAISTIRKFGVENVSALIQGKLGPGDRIEEGGLVAQVKAPKPAEPAPNVTETVTK